MSSVDQTVNTGQQSTTNYNTAKTFIGNNTFAKGNYTNSTYDAITLPEGRLLGRNTSGEIVPHESDASDGSQYPCGVLAHTVVVEEGDVKQLTFCDSGEVAEEQVVLGDGDTFNTVIDGRTLRDRIGADTVGVKLRAGTEMTRIDNQ